MLVQIERMTTQLEKTLQKRLDESKAKKEAQLVSICTFEDAFACGGDGRSRSRF